MKKRKLKKEVVAVIIALVVILAVMVTVLVLKNRNKFVYSEQLDSVVISIDDTNICLKEFTYYVMKVEEAGQERALMYDENDPLAYWNLYMHDVDDTSGYVTDIAKKSAVDYCIRDNIFAKEAYKAGVEIGPDEDSDIRYDAEMAYELMSNRQRTASELTADDFYIILYKQALAYKYMAQLAENDKDGTLEAIMLKYDVGGSYYETIKTNYNVVIYDDILENVKVGFVTVN